MIRNNMLFLRNVGETYFLAPSDDRKALVFLNETSAFLWNKLSDDVTEKELIEALLKEYDISYERAEKDVKKFITFLIENNCVCMEE